MNLFLIFITFVGHSMGGALAVHTALLDKINGLVGVVVVDVVEGTALDALSSMQSFLISGGGEGLIE